ncbi:RUS family member 1 [Hyalella azteca]|uniref:RUS family member 1 n=1 Tax=Hyalella azteca TaxID=294128 RepID=A0A8B7NRV1_HYAAZ|nr:RUS family member 1 [Hyalella azteca]
MIMLDLWTFSESRHSNEVFRYTVRRSTNGLLKCIDDKETAVSASDGVKASLLQWLREAFLPEGYPESVSEDYLHYQAWDTMQAYCSSVAGSVSLHATLGSLGVGHEGSTALAATLTWLTNTGAGMVASITFTYFKGTHLDSNNKQWRLFADVSNDVALLLRLATPLLVPYMPVVVPLTIAAVLTALVGVAGGATRAALTAHQARRNNLGDVAAKDGSQETLVNLAALLTSLVLLPLITHSLVMTWSVFMVLLALHLLCNYQAVRAVVARTLNRPRLLLLMQQFADTFTVMPLQEANAAEPLFTGSAFCAEFLCPGWRLELGSSLQQLLNSLRTKPRLDDNFAIVVTRRRVHVVLHDDVTDRQLLLACWTALHIARVASKTGSFSDGDVERVREKATQSFPRLEEALIKEGWAVDELHLNTRPWRVLQIS